MAEDSNVENIGSIMDKAARVSAAMTEDMWNGVNSFTFLVARYSACATRVLRFYASKRKNVCQDTATRCGTMERHLTKFQSVPSARMLCHYLAGTYYPEKFHSSVSDRDCGRPARRLVSRSGASTTSEFKNKKARVRASQQISTKCNVIAYTMARLHSCDLV